MFAIVSVIVDNFFDNFTVSFCDICSAELFPFQVASHAELHVMSEGEYVES